METDDPSRYGGVDDFFGKIEWEGGTTGALDYGLTAEGYELPPGMSEAWSEIVDLYRQLTPKLEVFYEQFAPEDFRVDD